MPRSISWQPRLNEMHRLVSESPRTPYSRDDLQKLFRVKPAAAKLVLQLLPRYDHAGAALVEREDLISFLSLCMDAEDLRAHLDAIRKSPPKPRRRMLRAYVARDLNAGKPLPHPADLKVSRNEIRMLFDTFDDFLAKVHAMLHLAEHPDFELRYCTPPQPTPQQQKARDESHNIDLHIVYLKKLHAATKAGAAGDHRSMIDRLREASKIAAELRGVLRAAGQQCDEDLLSRADEALAVCFPPSPAPQTSGPVSIPR